MRLVHKASLVCIPFTTATWSNVENKVMGDLLA